MATPDDIQKQLASRQPKITPVGDVPAATMRAAAPGAMDVPNATPTAQATASPARAALQAPPDFIGGPNGVQANTPSASWTTSPGAGNGPASGWNTTAGAQEPTMTRAAAQITEAPAWQTSPGAGAPPGTIDVPSNATRATQVPLNGANGSLPKPGTPTTTDPNDITADFNKRRQFEAARRAALASETATPAPGAAPAAAEAAAPAGGASGAANAAETLAADATKPGIVRRVVGTAGRVAGKVAGYGTSLVDLARAGNEAYGAIKTGDGNLGLDAATHAGEGALDAAATKVPTPWTIGAALAAHGTEALMNTDVAKRLTGDVIDMLPNSPRKQAQQAIADMDAQRLDRVKRGLPVPDAADYYRKRAELSGDANSDNFYTQTPLNTAGAAAVAGASPAQTAANTGADGKPKVNFIAPGDTTTRPPVLSDMTAAEAMKSNIPGTAVINGHVLTKEEIDDAGKRLNIVPSTAFTNPVDNGIEGNLNGTVNSDGGMMRVPLGNSASAQRMFGTDANGAPVGVSGGIGAPQDARQSTIHNLMGQISDALRSGRRRTAKILVDQLSAFDRASQGDMDNSLRRDALNKPPQPGAQTPAQHALDVARAGAAQTQEQVAQMGLEQAKQAQQIQAALQVETDPGKRKVLQQNLAAITGKGGSSGQQLKMANFTTGSGLDTRTIPVPIDMTTGRPVISPEYIQLIKSLQGGQPQAPQQKG